MNLMIPQLNRTQKGLSFERFSNALKGMLDGLTVEDRKKATAANEEFLRGLKNPIGRDKRFEGLAKALTPASVHVDATMNAFGVSYQNDSFIGERIMPIVSVSNRSDKYAVFSKRDSLSAPDDLIGYRSSPNEIERNFTFANYSLTDYGLKEYLDLEMVQNADNFLRDNLNTVEGILHVMALKREQRIAAIVETSGNYGATAAAVTKWDTAVSGGSIVSDILAGVASLWNGPAPTKIVGVTTLQVWNSAIINNPAITALFRNTREGLATTSAVANYFGLDDILVATGRQDNANQSATASYARTFTADNFAIIRVANNPNTRALQWGVTFREAGDPFITSWEDPSVGKRGGIYNRASVSEDHRVVAPDAGYLVTDVLT